MKKSGNRNRLINIIKLIVVTLVFVLLYKTGKIDINALAIVAQKPEIFAIATVLLVIGMLITVERWRILLRALDMSVNLWPAVNLTLIGTFFSLTLPGAVGGDVVKAYYLAKGQQHKAVLVATVVFDRILGLYTMILVSMFSAISVVGYVFITGEHPEWWGHSVRALIIFIVLLFAAFTFGASVFMSRRLSKTRIAVWLLTRLPFHDKVVKVHNAAHRFGHNLKFTFHATILSIISQFFMYAALWLLANMLGIDSLSFFHYLFALPVCILINAIPLSPGGLGVGEVGFGQIFAIFGSNKGVELAVLFHAITFIIGIGLGGISYLTFGRKENIVAFNNEE